MSNEQFQLPKTLMPIILLVIVGIIFISKSTVNIDAGEAGVLWKRFDGGVVTDKPPLGEGFHIVAPWNNVIVYEVRQQELYEKMKVLSSNGLDISLEMTVWYQPKYNDLGKLHQQKGEQYQDKVIGPVLRSAARSIVGRYTPEELYSSKRDTIQLEIFKESKRILDSQFVQLNEVLVRDVTLCSTFFSCFEGLLFVASVARGVLTAFTFTLID
jgi:regulator of protease activity HflC (stomatin/prohibitin superfamily)